MPYGGNLLDERLIGAADHRPIDGPRKEAHPVARMLALNLQAQKVVAFFARNQQQLVVRPAAAFVEHGLHLRQPQRAGVFGMAVAVELGHVDHVDAHLFHHADIFGRLAAARFPLLALPSHGRRAAM